MGGEAKRKGNRDERIAAAIERQSRIKNLRAGDIEAARMQMKQGLMKPNTTPLHADARYILKEE